MLTDVDQVVRLAVMKTPRHTPVVVAIDGRAGAGKTTLASAVAARLKAPVIHMDDLYEDWSGAVAGNRLLVERILTPLHAGEQVSYPTYDWHAGSYGGEVTLQPSVFVVVEGALSTYAEARDLVDVAIWLQAPTKVRKKRALDRDGDGFAAHWDQWAQQEETAFTWDRTKKKADLVLDTTTFD